MKIEINKFYDLNDETFKKIYPLYQQIFDDTYSLEQLKERTSNKESYLVLIARVDGKDVGLKVGFKEDDLFHSWIGGVLPEYRGKGIAKELTHVQHAWAKENGFSEVRTHTDHRFNNMLIHNIKNGFEIVDTQVRAHNGIRKLIMIKKL